MPNGGGPMNRLASGTSESLTRQRSWLHLTDLQHYGLAVLSVGIALGVSLLLQYFHFRVPAAPLLLFAVAISSWYGGTGPAVLAAALSVVSFYWYFVEPVRTIYIYLPEIPFFITFVGFAALLSWFSVIRRRVEANLRRSNRKLRVISECNQTLLRATDEQSLLDKICQIVREEAGYRMAFVAYAEHDEAKSVRPVAWNGAEEGYLATVGIAWADTERGRGPTGTAIRSGKSCCIQDFATDPRLAPWRESVSRRGFRSGIGLPLKDEQTNAFGCLTIYSAQPNAFAPDEIRLLEELAADLAFGVVTLRSRAARKRAEQALRESETRFRTFVDHAADAFFVLDEQEGHKVIDVNRQACESLGYTREELIGMVPTEFDPAVDAARLCWISERIDTGEVCTFETCHRRKDGTVFPVEMRVRLLTHSGGRLHLALARDITERKRSHEALQKSEAHLAEGQRLSHTGSWAWSTISLQSIYWSKEMYRMFALDPQQGVPTSEVFLERVHPEDRDRTYQFLLKLAHGASDYEHEHRIVLPDGTVKHIHAIGHPVLNESGELVEYVGTAIDVTERKQHEEALQRTAAYLAETQRLTHTGTFVSDNTTKPLYWSEELFRIFGFDPHQGLPTREQPLQRIHPEDLDKFKKAFDKGIREKVDADVEYRVVLPDRTVKHVHGIGHPVLNESGELVEYVGSVIDVTERKRAEEALRLSNAYNRSLIEASLDPLVTIGPDGKITDVNAATETATGCSRGELIGTDFCDYFTEPAQALVGYKQVFREGTVRDYPLELRRRNGRVMSVLYNASVYRDESGRVIGVFAAARDITERQRTEEALRESETRFRTFVDHAADAFFMLDFEQGTIIDVNRCACESLGYTREELIGMTPMAFDVNMDREILESVAERTAAGETVMFDTHWHRRKDGSMFPVEVLTSIFWHGGRRFLLKVAQDISDRVRAEEERERLRQLEADLAHINRVSMMGELAASIAHEVNQPLSGIVSNASASLRFLAGDAPNLEEVREAVRDIVRDGKRAGEVIARIRALTKRSEAATEKLDLNETIREVLALADDEAKRSSVMVRTQFAGNLSPVVGDRVQLQQVVLNLVMNAIEAMSSVSERQRELVITTRNVDPNDVQVTVEDSGTGLDPNTRDKIFDSFYTTKPGGMGMGLSISRSILQAHGGRLWAEGKDGLGTIFHFTVPKYHEEKAHARATRT